MVATTRLQAIVNNLKGTGYVFGQHRGRYKIGRIADADMALKGRADYFRITTTGAGLQTSEIREAEAYAAGIKAGRNL